MASSEFNEYNKKIATFICSSVLFTAPVLNSAALATKMGGSGDIMMMKYGGPMLDKPSISNPTMTDRYAPPMINTTQKVNPASINASVLNFQNENISDKKRTKEINSSGMPTFSEKGINFGKNQSILGRFLFK